MEENFKRIADSVRLPEGSRARIRTQIASHRKEQEASTVKQPKKHLPRLAVAAIIIAAALMIATLLVIKAIMAKKHQGIFQEMAEANKSLVK